MNRTVEMKALPLIDTLHSILHNFVSYLPLGFLILGFIGFVGNVLTYLQTELRASTCCVYSLCGSFVDISHLLLNALPEYLGVKQDIKLDWAHSDLTCRILYFFYVCLPNLSINFLVMAAIDRYACTCHLSSKLHRLNNRKILPWTISGTIFISCLSSIYAPILVYLHPKGFCDFYYGKIYTSFNLVMNGFIPLMTMLIFVLLTYYNIHSSRQRVTIISSTSNSNRFRNQFIALIITQVLFTAVISFQWMIVLMYVLVTAAQPRTLEQTFTLLFVLALSAYVHYLNNVKSFYLSLLTTKVFQEKFFGIFRRRRS